MPDPGIETNENDSPMERKILDVDADLVESTVASQQSQGWTWLADQTETVTTNVGTEQRLTFERALG